MGGAIKTHKSDSRLRTRMAATAAEHHGARLIVIDAEVRQRLTAFRADQLIAAPEVGFDALIGATEMMHILLFAQLRRATFRAFFAHMHTGGAAAITEVKSVEELALQKSVLALLLRFPNHIGIAERQVVTDQRRFTRVIGGGKLLIADEHSAQQLFAQICSHGQVAVKL